MANLSAVIGGTGVDTYTRLIKRVPREYIVKRKLRAIREDYGSFEYVLEFPDISGPRIQNQAGQDLPRKRSKGMSSARSRKGGRDSSTTDRR